MSVVGNQPVARFRNINEVIEEIRAISRSGNRQIEDDPQLLRVIERVGIRIEDIRDTADLIEKLERLKAVTEEKVLNEKITEMATTPEEDLGNARVPTAKIKELVEEYERHLEEGLTHEEAVARVGRNNKDVARNNVQMFLEKLRSNYKETLQKLASEAKSKQEDTERIAESVAKEQLLAEEKMVAAKVERELAAKIARETVGRVAMEKAAQKNVGVITETTKEIADETIRKYAEEVVIDGIEMARAQIEVEEKVEVIAKKLVEDLRSISPEEVARNKPEIDRVIRSGVAEQIKGGLGLEESFVTPQEIEEALQGEPEKLSEQIIKVLDLPPSKTAVVKRAVSEASVQTRELDSKTAAETMVRELITTSDVGLAAAAKVNADRLREIAEKEIGAAISEGRGFGRVSERVAAVLDPSKKVAIELAVERATRVNTENRERNLLKTNQVTERLISNLGVDTTIAAKLRTRENWFRSVVQPRIQTAVEGGPNLEEGARRLPDPKNLTQRIVNVLNVPQENVSQVNLAIKNTGLQVDRLIFLNRNSIRKIRAELIRNNTEQAFVAVNMNMTPKQVVAVHDYARFVGNFYSSVDLDVYKREAVAFAERRGNNPGSIKNAWNDMAGMSKVIHMSPAEFKRFQTRYFQIKAGLGDLKMPFGGPESRAFEGLMKLTHDVPEIRGLLSVTQNYLRISTSFNKFIGGFLQKIGLKEAGTKIIETVGNQALGEFVKNSLVVIAEHGTKEGVLMILKGILGGGVQAGAAAGTGTAAAGTAAAGVGTAAGSGALASAVAAFQAIPVVGQIILVVAAVLVAAIAVVRPIVNRVKKVIGDLLASLGADLSGLKLVNKKWLKDTFGGLMGGTLGVVADIGEKVVLAPMLILGLITMTFVGPLIVLTVIGFALVSCTFHQKASTVVPRRDPVGVEIIKYREPAEVFVPGPPLPTRDPSIVIPDSCPGIWPTRSGVVSQGPLGQWSHRTTQAIDIAVGTRTVAIVATHNGRAIPGGGTLSPYGYYVDVFGVCNGKPIRTRYAHMPGRLFLMPREVKQGELIGYVDNTGNSTGPHLHYELTGGQINDWLPKPVPLKCSEIYECNVSIP